MGAFYIGQENIASNQFTYRTFVICTNYILSQNGNIYGRNRTEVKFPVTAKHSLYLQIAKAQTQTRHSQTFSLVYWYKRTKQFNDHLEIIQLRRHRPTHSSVSHIYSRSSFTHSCRALRRVLALFCCFLAAADCSLPLSERVAPVLGVTLSLALPANFLNILRLRLCLFRLQINPENGLQSNEQNSSDFSRAHQEPRLSCRF